MDNDLIDMIAAEEPSATDVHDKIKDILYAKSAKRIYDLRPTASSNLFGSESEAEVETEVETQPEEETND